MQSIIRLSFTLIFFILISSFSLKAQQTSSSPKAPRWLSDAGYWVVETNGTDRHCHVIYFYNNKHEMVYKESLTGVRLRLAKRNVKMKLRKVLETSVASWERNEHLENLALVASAL